MFFRLTWLGRTEAEDTYMAPYRGDLCFANFTLAFHPFTSWTPHRCSCIYGTYSRQMRVRACTHHTYTHSLARSLTPSHIYTLTHTSAHPLPHALAQIICTHSHKYTHLPRTYALTHSHNYTHSVTPSHMHSYAEFFARWFIHIRKQYNIYRHPVRPPSGPKYTAPFS